MKTLHIYEGFRFQTPTGYMVITGKHPGGNYDADTYAVDDDGNETKQAGNTVLTRSDILSYLRDSGETYTDISDPMTYGEYFEEHDTENLSWCRPFADANGHYLILHDGDVLAIVSDGQTYYRYNGTLTEDVLEAFARSVNPQYDDYTNQTDEHIALDAMYETGCFYCPLKDTCEPMQEEMPE